MATTGQAKYPPPNQRQLKIFSFDPAADVSMETAGISRCLVDIPWESVEPGPVGQYVEVVDVDPSSNCVYEPVDLMAPHLLASQGLDPSTGNPQFHQQMVYAVAMKTIHNFERVLGRRIQWSERLRDDKGEYSSDWKIRYVDRLRIYPHALRDQNAYYSPAKKALLFGYFNAPTSDPRDALPGGVIFTCLSHDIVAHETTHAIVDGLHRRLLDDTNPDMLAFHEAIADIVAIFQHFTLPGVLLDQIQRTRGDLRIDNLLVKLAAQFARATGRGGALRNALGERDDDGRQATPDPTKLGRTRSPHERGAILVAAIFDAFLRIYENRVKDLRRIATGGTGVLPKGDIHPDLAGRLAEEAAAASQHVLNICIRALDYLPPVDVTFGDYLRSLITADADSYPHDARHYRLAFIEAFRERGIYPNDVRTLSEDSLRWREMKQDDWDKLKRALPPPAVLRTMAYTYGCESSQLISRLRAIDYNSLKYPKETANRFLEECWISVADCVPLKKNSRKSAHSISEDLEDPDQQEDARRNRYQLERQFARFLHYWITKYAQTIQDPQGKDEEEETLGSVGYHFGLDLGKALASIEDPGKHRLEVHAVRPTIRLRADGRSKVELVVLLTQSSRHDLYESGENEEADKKDRPTFKLRGGCTLLIDPEEGMVRCSIAKNILSDRRRHALKAFLHDRVHAMGLDGIERYSLRSRDKKTKPIRLEPFALTHGSPESGDEYYG